jgi:hypothetical protein
MATKKIAVRLTVTIDVDAWADEYGCDRRDVPENLRNYIRTAVQTMPVEPELVEVK